MNKLNDIKSIYESIQIIINKLNEINNENIKLINKEINQFEE